MESLLVAVPHFYDPNGSGRYGSTRRDSTARLTALRQMIVGLHANLGGRAAVLDISRRKATPGPHGVSIKIVIVTTGTRHLLDRIDLPPDLYTQVNVDIDNPMHLGFECHRVLAQAEDQNDWFGFMEDDLVVHDPMLLKKSRWFSDSFGPNALLQPNRYEWVLGREINRLYIDGPLRPAVTQAWRNVSARAALCAAFAGGKVVFDRALNPHAGAFFLNRQQFKSWASSPHFLDGDTSFIGPLESAATLGLMKTFEVYKTSPEFSDFYQVEHAGRAFMGMIGREIPLASAD